MTVKKGGSEWREKDKDVSKRARARARERARETERVEYIRGHRAVLFELLTPNKVIIKAALLPGSRGGSRGQEEVHPGRDRDVECTVLPSKPGALSIGPLTPVRI